MRDWRCNPSQSEIDAIRRSYPTEATVDDALSRKMQLRAKPARGLISAAEIQDSLTRFIQAHIQGNFEISGMKSLAGGSSKPQFVFYLKHGGTEIQKLVLRLETGEAIVQTSRLREFQILDALQGQLPVPKPCWIDLDGAFFGTPAFVYAFCPGVSRPPRMGQISGPQQGYGEHYRKLLAPQFVDYLADLSMASWDTSKLSAFEIPAAGTKEAAIQGVNWWQRVWEEDRLKAVPIMSLTANWLRENAPVADRISVLHGDYRSGNFLFDLESGNITALLDWELVRLGDRHEDLAYILNPLYSTADADGTELIGGFLPREEYMERYERRSGLPIDYARLSYYEIYNLWKQTIITVASSARCVSGRKSHQDILVGMSYMIGPTVFQILCNAMKEKI